MLDVIEAKIDPTKTRIGTVVVSYYDLALNCDICVYNTERVWIRLPEWWQSREEKKRLAFWPMRDLSNSFQESIVSKVFNLLNLNLEEAIKIKKAYFKKRKELTSEKNKFILNEKIC